jgi:hypothetical protein
LRQRVRKHHSLIETAFALTLWMEWHGDNARCTGEGRALLHSK